MRFRTCKIKIQYKHEKYTVWELQSNNRTFHWLHIVNYSSGNIPAVTFPRLNRNFESINRELHQHLCFLDYVVFHPFPLFRMPDRNTINHEHHQSPELQLHRWPNLTYFWAWEDKKSGFRKRFVYITMHLRQRLYNYLLMSKMKAVQWNIFVWNVWRCSVKIGGNVYVGPVACGSVWCVRRIFTEVMVDLSLCRHKLIRKCRRVWSDGYGHCYSLESMYVLVTLWCGRNRNVTRNIYVRMQIFSYYIKVRHLWFTCNFFFR